MNILEHYDENNIYLHEPETYDNENYFCKLDYGDKPFIIQTNHICYNFKNIIEETIYISIGSPDYALWIEQLYHLCIKHIYDKSKDWFDEPLEYRDIENSFLTPIKTNIKLNCYDVKCNVHNNNCVIVNNNGKCVEKEDLLNTKIIPTIHIKGIQFNSKHFEFDMDVKYIVVYGNYEESKEDKHLEENIDGLDNPEQTNKPDETNQDEEENKYETTNKQPEIKHDKTNQDEEENKYETTNKQPEIKHDKTTQNEQENKYEETNKQPEIKHDKTTQNEQENKYEETSQEEIIQNYHNENEILDNEYLEENKNDLEENKDDLEEFEILPDNDEPIHMMNNDKSLTMIYELATNRIEQDVIEHLRQILTNKKIKINLDLEELFNEDSDSENE